MIIQHHLLQRRLKWIPSPRFLLYLQVINILHSNAVHYHTFFVLWSCDKRLQRSHSRGIDLYETRDFGGFVFVHTASPFDNMCIFFRLFHCSLLHKGLSCTSVVINSLELYIRVKKKQKKTHEWTALYLDFIFIRASFRWKVHLSKIRKCTRHLFQKITAQIE